MNNKLYSTYLSYVAPTLSSASDSIKLCLASLKSLLLKRRDSWTTATLARAKEEGAR